MKTADIKITEKNITSLGDKDSWVIIEGMMMRYMECGRTLLHNHRYWKFKRLNPEGRIETYTMTDKDARIICLNW